MVQKRIKPESIKLAKEKKEVRINIGIHRSI